MKYVSRTWLVALLAVTTLCSCKPRPGKVIEFRETANSPFHVRITSYTEKYGGFVPGAYYVFSSAPRGANSLREIMTFRHDDMVTLPFDQVRFVNDHIGFVFMGWMYAVTTDGGNTWKVWDAMKDLPNWQCCNYGLIRDVRVEADGRGVMELDPIQGRRGEVPLLSTRDWGRHWVVKAN